MPIFLRAFFQDKSLFEPNQPLLRLRIYSFSAPKVWSWVKSSIFLATFPGGSSLFPALGSLGPISAPPRDSILFSSYFSVRASATFTVELAQWWAVIRLILCANRALFPSSTLSPSGAVNQATFSSRVSISSVRARRVKYLVVFCSCASHTGCVLKLAEDEQEPEGGLREKIRESVDQKAALSVSGFLPLRSHSLVNGRGGHWIFSVELHWLKYCIARDACSRGYIGSKSFFRLFCTCKVLLVNACNLLFKLTNTRKFNLCTHLHLLQKREKEINLSTFVAQSCTHFCCSQMLDYVQNFWIL